jgi:hypothetical protein
MRTLPGLLLTVFFSVIISGAAQAQIVWTSTGTITGDSDVSTYGLYFDAAQLQVFHSAPQTVNGVVFNAFNGASGDGKISIFGEGQGSDSYSGGGLSTAYQDILTDTAYVNAGQTGTISLSGLTFGQEYQVQIWNAAGRNTLYSGTSTLQLPGSDYAIGDFTAAGPDFSFTFTNSTSPFSSYGEIFDVSVRSIPEPSTYAMMIAGLAVLGFGLRRKRAVLRA